MRGMNRRLLAVLALLVSVTAAVGDVDRIAMAKRYADFKKQQKTKWALAKTVGTISGLLGVGDTVLSAADRAVRYQIRLSTGHINPTTIPMFGSDLAGRQQQLDTMIGITDSHATSTGTDVVVAVLDSGFNLHHPAIASRILPYGFDPVGQDWDPQDRGDGIDDDGDGITDGGVGHGTFVSGMVLSVAPNAWILPVRIADDEGYGLENELVSGIDYAIAMDVDVINISYEAGTFSQSIVDKLHEANSHGITVVVSAGNEGSDQLEAMAADGTVISVGAVDYSDAIALFSNTPSDGQGLSLFAPGVDLYGPHGGPADDTDCTWSGTSFSAPLATGAVALTLQLHRGLTPELIRDRLRAASTTPVTAWSGATYPYTGRLDLRAVVGQ